MFVATATNQTPLYPARGRHEVIQDSSPDNIPVNVHYSTPR